MKLKAAVRDDTGSEQLMHVFGSPDFVGDFYMMLEDIFGVEEPYTRPAEYYVQTPDKIVGAGNSADPKRAVEVRLTGVSRAGRDPQVFIDGLHRLQAVVEHKLAHNLHAGTKAQMFVVIMLDGEIYLPATGTYSSVLESKPRWVDGLKTTFSDT